MMVSNNFMKIQMGEGVFEQAVLEIQVGGGGEGGQKTVPSVVGLWISSRITQYLSGGLRWLEGISSICCLD